jgi:hypothetical protein
MFLDLDVAYGSNTKSYLELDAAGLDLSSFNMMAVSDGNGRPCFSRALSTL